MRLLRAAAAGLLLFATLVGIPALLAVTIGNPLDAWPAVVAGDLSDTVLIDVLAAIAYLAWAQFAAAVVSEGIATMTRIRVPARVPFVFAGQRRLAHALITATFLLTPATTSVWTPDLMPHAVTVATAPVNATLPVVVGATHEPASHRQPGGAPATPAPTYTIRSDGPGTYWDLAEHFLGDGQRWPEIWHLNDGRRQPGGAVMTSPGLLRPGWIVLLPAASDTQRSTGQVDTVTVARGDSLWSIADEHLGDGRQWPNLFRRNKNTRQPDGGRLTDPDLIRPGWTLTLPDHDAAPVTPTLRPSGSTGPTPPAQEGSASPGPAATTAPTPTTTSATPRATVTATTESSAALRPAAAPPQAEDAPAIPIVGIDLPGGWIGLPLGAAISAAAAMVWIRRRQRHRYQPLDDDPDTDDLLDDDDDLQPLPAVVDRVRRAIRDQAPALLDRPAPRVSVAEYLADPARIPIPPPGPNALELADLTDLVRADLVRARGLGLTGPGADSAARALIVAALTAGGTHDPDAQGSLVIPASTLRRLVGIDPDRLTGLARMHVTVDLDRALDVLDEIHLQRQRTLDDYDADDAAALLSDPATPPMPQLILLAEAPTDDSRRQRLTALLDQGTSKNLTAVLLGDWPPGATTSIARDGNTQADGQRVRVATLDQPTAADLLAVIAEAEPDPSRQERQPSLEIADLADTSPHETSADPASTLTSEKVQIRIFGEVAVLDHEGQPVPGLRQHAGGLLAYLAIYRKGADKNDILEAIWPDAPLRRAAERLATEVGNLRRTIRAVANDATTQPVENTGGRYRLNYDVVDLDLWRFEDALHEAGSAADDAVRQPSLQLAIDTCTPDLARGHDYHWLEPLREQQRRRAIRAHLQLADLVAADEAGHAATLTQNAARLDPTNEQLSRLAIQAHARAGDKPAVDAELRRLKIALREIDETPSPETLSLVAACRGAEEHFR